MQFRFLLMGILSIAMIPFVGLAQTGDNDVRVFFEYVADIPTKHVQVPTVFEIDLPPFIFSSHLDGAVYEEGTGVFIRSGFSGARQAGIKPTISILRNAGRIVQDLQDNDDNTFYVVKAFPDGVQRGDTWISTISLRWQGHIDASRVIVRLKDGSVPPENVLIEGDGRTLAPWQAYNGDTISFATTSVRNIVIQLEHTADIEISEVSVPYSTDPNHKMRFLMQPDETYKLYAKPTDTVYTRSISKQGTYFTYNGFVQNLGLVTLQKSKIYNESDIDGDGIIAEQDNCVRYANADQEDKNNNGVGDACEDFDNDGLVAALDNCPDRPNKDQRDTDGDGLGDACDDVESRLTEQHAWVPLAGIVIAGIVLLLLFASVAISTRRMERAKDQDTDRE